MSTPAPILELHGNDAPLRVFPGTFNLLRGPAGSGRAALLRVLGLLDPPLAGELFFEGQPTRGLSAAAREELRNQRSGFVFAAPFLLATFTALENVAMPLFKISHVDPEQARQRTEALLAFVGLAAVAQAPVGELSDYQQHAVSLARALANEPAVLIVERLDPGFSAEQRAAFATLLRAASAQYRAAILVSAPLDFPPEKSDRVLELAGGRVICDSQLLENTLS